MDGQPRTQPATGGRYFGREMPSLFIFHRNVERFIVQRRVRRPYSVHLNAPGKSSIPSRFA